MKGFVQSGKLGVVTPVQRMGQAIPIPAARIPAYDGCPPGYSRNILGVCMLGPEVVAGASTIYTAAPVVLAGRRRR